MDCIRSASTEALEWAKAMCQDETGEYQQPAETTGVATNRLHFNTYSVSISPESFHQCP